MNQTDAIEAIEAGCTTNKEIADYHDLDHRHVGKYLKEFAENGVLDRERGQHGFVYEVADDDDPSDEIPDDLDGENLPVDRDYNWDAYVPDESEVTDYVPTNGEWQEFNAEIDARDVTERAARCLLTGDTGTAKTTMAENIAAKRGWPLFTIQVRYSMDEADLLGMPEPKGDRFVWVDGPLTKALLCSRERPIVLLIDEANRAPARSKSVLFSALDHRAQVTLDARGGEVVEGDPLNIVSVSTINEGPGFQTERMDKAEKRRYGNKYEIQHLTESRPGDAADLIARETPAPLRLADLFVDVTQDINSRARDATSTHVDQTVPVAALLEWASTAAAYDEADLDNPVVGAGQSAVVRKFYDDDDARDEVESIIKSSLDGAPFDEDALEAWAGESGDERVICTESACDYNEPVSTAEEHGALDWMECPDCGCTVERRSL